MTLSAADKAGLMRSATRASLLVAAVLSAIKGGAWVWTGSVSMLASLVDSVIDLTASALTLLAVHASLRPPDREHRFGHGKLEPLAGLGQALLVGGSALMLLVSAVHRLRDPQPVQGGAVGIAVMVVASAATLWLVRYQRHVIDRTGSTAVSADSLHYKSDLLMNAAVVAALIASDLLGWQLVDPLFGLIVAVLVGRSAWRIATQAVQLLIDREFPDHERQAIMALVQAQPHVKGIHDLRTRHSGTQPFIQFHLELDGQLSLQRAHAISDAVEAQVMQRYPDAEIIIHLDPGFDPRDGLGFEQKA